VSAPPLIDRAMFGVVQNRLEARNPMVTPAHISGGPAPRSGIR